MLEEGLQYFEIRQTGLCVLLLIWTWRFQERNEQRILHQLVICWNEWNRRRSAKWNRLFTCICRLASCLM